MTPKVDFIAQNGAFISATIARVAQNGAFISAKSCIHSAIWRIHKRNHCAMYRYTVLQINMYICRYTLCLRQSISTEPVLGNPVFFATTRQLKNLRYNSRITQTSHSLSQSRFLRHVCVIPLLPCGLAFFQQENRKWTEHRHS